MKRWLDFFTVFVIARIDLSGAQPHYSNEIQPSHLRVTNEKTDIQNKNVNIIVNMDSKTIANELWNIIKEHLNVANQEEAATTLHQIENAIKPVLTPTRRGGQIPVAQIAEDLESITRRLIINEDPHIEPLRLDALTNEISYDLMAALQNIWYGIEIDSSRDNGEGDRTNKQIIKNETSEESESIDSVEKEEEQYVDLLVKIKKNDLTDAFLEAL